VVHVEREAYAAACLVARMEEKVLDRAPVWDDLGSFDGSRWRGRVDLVVAGFPCQPASVAGKRAGRDDERWLWPLVERTVEDVGPEWVFLENVRGLLSVDGGEGFASVLGGLDALGFDAEWLVLRASDVGAPHRRERVFVLAHATRERAGESINETQTERGGRPRQGVGVGSLLLGDAVRSRLAGRSSVYDDDRAQRATAERAGGLDVADAERGELRNEPGRRGGEDGAGAPEPRAARPFPPGSDDADGWRDYLERYPDLAPAVESPVRRGADGLADGLVDSVRADSLRLLGNGVVPEQAAAAFVELYQRFAEGGELG